MDKGVFVKDMVMPSTCIECEFVGLLNNIETFCMRDQVREAREIGSPRPNWCSLTADVRPVVHGHWENDKHGLDRSVCSECGATWEGGPYNFCPRCGADMREVAQDG